ncbi:DNA-directed RNA polymerase subunit omega [bacterium BMS3Abin14]|nr:DNA-directed RNA polymerase subunit omega [bacterium BMS3Abin14]
MDLRVLEKSLENQPNRFELTMMAVARARELSAGEKPLIEVSKDEKVAIVALKELAAGLLVPATLEEMESIREETRLEREKARRKAMEAVEAEAESEMNSQSASSADGSTSP